MAMASASRYRISVLSKFRDSTRAFEHIGIDINNYSVVVTKTSRDSVNYVRMHASIVADQSTTIIYRAEMKSNAFCDCTEQRTCYVIHNAFENY